MRKRGTLLWGFVGTTVLTSIMSASQAAGYTRMNLPYLLGTMVTPNRDRARLLGFAMHFVNGWLFASIYAAAFESWRRAGWWLGALIGATQAAFVLSAGMTVLPSLHPRMASEQAGPTPVKQLEPPGFLALNYGYQTPFSVLVAHVAYGAILGAFYRPRRSWCGASLDGIGVLPQPHRPIAELLEAAQRAPFLVRRTLSRIRTTVR